MNAHEYSQFKAEFDELKKYPFIQELLERHPAVLSIFNDILLEGENALQKQTSLEESNMQSYVQALSALNRCK